MVEGGCAAVTVSKQLLQHVENVTDIRRGVRAVRGVRRILVVVTGKTIESWTEVAVRRHLKRFHRAVGQLTRAHTVAIWE